MEQFKNIEPQEGMIISMPKGTLQLAKKHKIEITNHHCISILSA